MNYASTLYTYHGYINFYKCVYYLSHDFRSTYENLIEYMKAS